MGALIGMAFDALALPAVSTGQHFWRWIMGLDDMIAVAASQAAKQSGLDERSARVVAVLVEQYCARLSAWERAHMKQSELNSWARHYAAQHYAAQQRRR